MLQQSPTLIFYCSIPIVVKEYLVNNLVVAARLGTHQLNDSNKMYFSPEQINSIKNQRIFYYVER